MTTTPTDLAPVIVVFDECHGLLASNKAELPDLTAEQTLALMRAAHTEMNRRAAPVAETATDQHINTAGSLIVLAGALTGLAQTAMTRPDLVGYPITASFAAMVIGAVVLLRTPSGNAR
ncbi:hypothetical protein FHR83_006744 [Actinoplanes campanulatus]|uniref:Uncharacterized protein n=1 Tax=Actinoplanes campanulatus TaxID=113559 RepID=A0A7W5FHU9_9ACTN|nr:hypothetical protein [Actinoplanes campanulatus]MBB3099038.1 hypothetical protein [Actinoplanes campanulatus]GGN39331.1 hypothetical protein GCM10010109_67130 [Actinoplanes campanulatus]GID40196.1 hypothetical protein Aca09nite_67020 [Actinoplanes campanulatus]